MTRPAQKQSEEEVVTSLLAKLGTTGRIIGHAEPPDVVVEIGGARIGCEVTGYHDQSLTPAGRTTREVEADWEKLKAKSDKVKSGHSDIENINVLLNFRELKVPRRAEADQFIAEAVQYLKSKAPDVSDELQDYSIGPGYPILQKYLRGIAVSDAGCTISWDWDRSCGFVGATDQSLFDAIGKKLGGTRPSGFSEYWLVVYGGHRISQVPGVFSSAQLNSFLQFNTAIRASPFDCVYLLDFGTYVWTRATGWMKVKKR